MKSTGLSKVDLFYDTYDEAPMLRLPRPFITRKRAAGNQTFGTGTLNTCGSIIQTIASDDGSVTVGGSGAGTNVAVTNVAYTDFLSEGMIVLDVGTDNFFRNGSSNNLTRIVSVDSTSQITVDHTLNNGTGGVMFANPGNTLMKESSGYYPGYASLPPPASGKLICSMSSTPDASATITYDSFTPGPTRDYSFNITGSSTGSVVVGSRELLVAEHTTGDGLGSNVRIMWMGLNLGRVAVATQELKIKSWETGDVIFSTSIRQMNARSYRGIQFVEIPAGGAFCEGGAVFEFGDGSVKRPIHLSVGYQI
jgi:hypothetical protein